MAAGDHGRDRVGAAGLGSRNRGGLGVRGRDRGGVARLEAGGQLGARGARLGGQLGAPGVLGLDCAEQLARGQEGLSAGGLVTENGLGMGPDARRKGSELVGTERAQVFRDFEREGIHLVPSVGQ